MKPSSIMLDHIRIARPQEGDTSPDAIVQFEFRFDGPGDRIGPNAHLTISVGYDAGQAVSSLLDAAADEALRVLGVLSSIDPKTFRSMLDDSFLPRDSS